MENKITYRTLVLKYDILRLSPEVAVKIPELLKIQQEFHQWVDQWLKTKTKPAENPLKRLVTAFLYAMNIKKSSTEVQRTRPPIIFDVQLRLNNERDIGRSVFVDLPRRQVRIRKWSRQHGNSIVLPLNDEAVRWILERVKEGGRPKLAAVWVGKSGRNRNVKLYVALTFCREVVHIKFKRLLVIDFNALHHGLAWAVVEGEKILKKGVLRPNISKILHLQKNVSRLDKLCAEKDEVCDKAVAVNSRVWRLLRAWEDRVVKELIWMARKRKAAIIVDVPEDKSIRALKEGFYATEKKIFLNFGRLRRRLKGLAEWYGVPYREVRLYSTICPRCGAKMEELPNRRVKCTACGFETHRDEVPFYWASKRFSASS